MEENQDPMNPWKGKKSFNISKVLQQRQNLRFNMSDSPVPFLNIRLQASYVPPVEDLLGSVIEIIPVDDILFVRHANGHCYAYNRETQQMICRLNGLQERIRQLSYNKFTKSVIVSWLLGQATGYRSIRLGDIRMGETNGVPLDVGGDLLFYFEHGIIIQSVDGSLMNVLDMNDYNILFSTAEQHPTLAISHPGFVSVCHGLEDEIRIDVVCMESWEVVKSIHRPLDTELEFLEQIDEIILMKQAGRALTIYNVYDDQEIEVPGFVNPVASMALRRKRQFLTVTGRSLNLWTVRGQLIRDTFQDHVLAQENSLATSYVTHDQDHIFSLCRGHGVGHNMDRSINITCLKSGKCVGKIARDRTDSKIAATTVAEAVGDVTFITYDEERLQIYTGTEAGNVFVWSS